MKVSSHQTNRSGIALIVVLIVIVVLGILAGGFAYSMRVETTLARHASFNTELDWIGRAGVNYCQWILSQPCPQEPYDSLDQIWAGGSGGRCTNETIVHSGIPIPAGQGSFTWKMEDNDRYFNINVADEIILNEALTLIGVDAGQMTTVVNSILDWRDLDKNPRMSGAESEVYEQYDPPYEAKDGPIDDMSELMLIRGITPGIYKGSSGGPLTQVVNRAAGQQSVFDEPTYSIGLVNLFAALSGPTVNINTAAADVLQLMPQIDENYAQRIIQGRAPLGEMEGLIGAGGYRSIPEVRQRVPDLPVPDDVLARYFGVRSQVFKAEITATMGSTTRKYVALLRRVGPKDTRVLTFYSSNPESPE
jgi:general secretion pathway protein K